MINWLIGFMVFWFGMGLQPLLLWHWGGVEVASRTLDSARSYACPACVILGVESQVTPGVVGGLDI